MTPLRRGMTLMEIMVASAILSLLALVSMNLLAVLQRANVTVAQNVDISSNARRILSDMARDLRQTGWAYNEAANTNLERGPSTSNTLTGFGATVFGDTSAGDFPTLAFRIRTGFANDLEADWNTWIEYRVVADGNFTGINGTPNRFALQKRVATDVDASGSIDAGEPDNTYVIAEDLSRVVFLRPDGGDSGLLDDRNIDIRLQLTRIDPAPAARDGINVEFRERVRMNNLPEDRN